MKLLRLLLLQFTIATLQLATSHAELLSGTTTPTSEQGSNGDHYLKTTNSTIYKKVDGAWSVIANVRASKGDKGDRGETGQRGQAGPIGPAGPGLRTFPNQTLLNEAAPQFVGQLAFRTDNNALYRGSALSAGSWVQLTYIPPIVYLSPEGATTSVTRATPYGTILILHNESVQVATFDINNGEFHDTLPINYQAVYIKDTDQWRRLLINAL